MRYILDMLARFLHSPFRPPKEVTYADFLKDMERESRRRR